MFDSGSLLDIGRRLAGLDAAGGTVDDLAEGVVALERMRALLDVSEARLLAELDARDATDREFGLRTSMWVARETKVPKRVARDRVRVANALRPRFGEVEAAVLDGRLSWDHAKAISDAGNSRIIDDLTAIQHVLIDLAAGVGYDQWRGEVTNLIKVLDPDGRDPDDDRSTISMGTTLDGATKIAGMLYDETALIVTEAVNAKADELTRRYVREHDDHPEIAIPARGQIVAEALRDLIRLALGTDPENSDGPVTEVTLVASASDPLDIRTAAGVKLQDGTVRRLLCDPRIFAAIVNSLGVPLDLGREFRYANRAQRRALLLRDGGCAFPGCDAPARWCDVHHVDHWEHGGKTNVARMVLLCRHHHRVTHRRGWSLHATDDSWFWWRTPTGRTVWSQRHGRPRTGPTPPDDPVASQSCHHH